MDDCIFCQREKLEIIAEKSLVFAIRDKSPVTEGHTLIIPKEHRVDFFELTEEERSQSFELINELKEDLGSDKTITGFNIGMNCGESAGQTIFHCHIHLIPRRDGDMASPRGGVRGVIPEKQSY